MNKLVQVTLNADQEKYNLDGDESITFIDANSYYIGIMALVPGLDSMIKLSIFTIFAIILSSGLVLDYPYPTELFGIKVRGTGVGTCITISRFGAAAGTFLLPVLTNIGGAKLAMLVCAIVLLFAFIVCLIWAPETSPKFIKAEQNNN